MQVGSCGRITCERRTFIESDHPRKSGWTICQVTNAIKFQSIGHFRQNATRRDENAPS
jgi:hypothetical protein